MHSGKRQANKLADTQVKFAPNAINAGFLHSVEEKGYWSDY